MMLPGVSDDLFRFVDRALDKKTLERPCWKKASILYLCKLWTLADHFLMVNFEHTISWKLKRRLVKGETVVVEDLLWVLDNTVENRYVDLIDLYKSSIGLCRIRTSHGSR
jgi:hypothetical protein